MQAEDETTCNPASNEAALGRIPQIVFSTVADVPAQHVIATSTHRAAQSPRAGEHLQEHPHLQLARNGGAASLPKSTSGRTRWHRRACL